MFNERFSPPLRLNIHPLRRRCPFFTALPETQLRALLIYDPKIEMSIFKLVQESNISNSTCSDPGLRGLITLLLYLTAPRCFLNLSPDTHTRLIIEII